MNEIHRSKEIVVSISSTNNVLVLNDRHGNFLQTRIDLIFDNPKTIDRLEKEIKELNKEIKFHNREK